MLENYLFFALLEYLEHRFVTTKNEIGAKEDYIYY